MPINIDFDYSQTERIIAALEAVAYSYAWKTGYLQHAEELAKKDTYSLSGKQGSYALTDDFPSTVKQVLEMDEESLTKLLRSAMNAARDSGVYSEYFDKLSARQLKDNR